MLLRLNNCLRKVCLTIHLKYDERQTLCNQIKTQISLQIYNNYSNKQYYKKKKSIKSIKYKYFRIKHRNSSLYRLYRPILAQPDKDDKTIYFLHFLFKPSPFSLSNSVLSNCRCGIWFSPTQLLSCLEGIFFSACRFTFFPSFSRSFFSFSFIIPPF